MPQLYDIRQGVSYPGLGKNYEDRRCKAASTLARNRDCQRSLSAKNYLIKSFSGQSRHRKGRIYGRSEDRPFQDQA